MRQSVLAALLTMLLTCAFGCTELKRSLIASEVRGAVLAMQPESEQTSLSDLGGGLYTYRWLVYRTAFITTSEGVILFEPLNEDAVKDIVARLPSLTKRPEIRYVIYSHHHEDHISGGAAVPGKPTFVAHANTARDIGAWPHEHVVPPTEIFESDQHTIELGGVKVVLRLLPAGHTDGNIAMYVPSRRALFASDVAFPGWIPPVGMPFTSYHRTRASIRALQQFDYDTFIPSHGRVGDRKSVDAYDAFLADAEAALRSAIDAHGIDSLHGDRALYGDPHFAEIIFEATDALEPKWSHLVGFEEQSFQALQWVFFHAVMMNE